MKKEIIKLFNSDNIEDRVLGILMMEENNIDIFPPSDNGCYSKLIRVKGFDKYKHGRGFLVEINTKTYYICHNSFIGLLKNPNSITKDDLILIYTDNTL